MEEKIKKAEAAYSEIIKMIADNSERGQFNSLYFRKPFFEWFAKKIDEEIENV